MKKLATKLSSLSVLMCLAAGLTVSADPSPLVKVTSPDPYALEGASSGSFTIVRDSGITNSLDIKFQILGTALNGVDYVTISNVVTIPVGFSAVDIVVIPIPHPLNQPTKSVVITLETNAHYRIDKHHSATVKIVDDVFHNAAPAVSITSPTNNTIVSVPGDLSITADANDADGAIQKVTFYANDKVIGTATNSPYSLVWSSVQPGKYAIFARATDEFDKSTLSTAVHVVAANPAPVVNLISPTNTASFGHAAKITIEASASDADGISKVSFYVDNRFFAALTNAPYSVVWSNATLGKHSVIAQATDAYGQSSFSHTAKITVINALPLVSLVNPTNGAVFKALTPIVLEAQASDADGGIKKVSFYAGDHSLGSVTNAPYSIIVNNLKAGTYKLSAKAIDTAGQSVTSKSVKVTITR